MTTTHSRAQRGSTMVVVLVLLVALLAAGAIALRMQLSNTKASGIVRATKSSLYCAEAGLAAARPRIGGAYALWSDMLDADPSNDPAWYPVLGDLDGDGTNDYRVTIRDNDDEAAPAPNKPHEDNDLRIFLVSQCTRASESDRQVLELIAYDGGGTVYRNQAGQGAGNTGNIN